MRPNIYQKHIDIPYSQSDMEVARRLLSVFNVHYAGEAAPEDRRDSDDDDDDDRSDGDGWPITLSPWVEELAVKLADILAYIRNDERARRYVIPPRRKVDGSWAGELAQLMWPLGFFWTVDIDEGEFPSGPFPEPEIGGRPVADTGADFIYIALHAIGLQFSDAEFRDQFTLLRLKLAQDFECDEDEGESD